jgi:membrane protease subunit HflC
MKIASRLVLTILAVAVVVALVRSVVIVDQSETAFVTAFGRPVRLIDDAGLHFKWPHEGVRMFDRRLHLDSPAAREMLTKDKKNLEIAWYTSWRIADVEKFLRTVRTMLDASARLDDMAAAVLAAELGGRELGQLVSVGDRSLLNELASGSTGRIAEQALQEYGIEVKAVRLRRLNYPEEVRAAVFEQIRSERQRVAAATRAEGDSQARIIRSAADRDRATVIAQAESDAARKIGEGEALATRTANEAQSADPAFYQFLKTLETYRVALDARTTLVLSAESRFLQLLTQGTPEIGNEKIDPSRSSGSSQPSTVAVTPMPNLAPASRALGSATSAAPSNSDSRREGRMP